MHGRITWNNGIGVRILLISTYDLGRQPFGLASPAAWLRRAGVNVECVDTSRESLTVQQIRDASLVAFYLPMHTATRLAAPLLDAVQRVNPGVPLAAYGLYAPLNAAWLRERGVAYVLGPECEGELVDLVLRSNSPAFARSAAAGPRHSSSTSVAATSGGGQLPTPNSHAQVPGALTEDRVPRLAFIQPDRSTLPPLTRYAALQMPDGTRRVVGSTEASRGCKHLCRHCPIVPVYRGAFRVIPVDVVLADVRAQIATGAQHITFADPDFFNGPTHARRVVERFAAEFPGVTYDVTIKVEHLLARADMLSLLRETGCLFVTSAVESVDETILQKLRKGHTRQDFVRAVALCRAAGVTLSPTFVPFTPWTTVDGYIDLLETLQALDLADAVAPIQLAMRLLVTADSALLELPELTRTLEPFDGDALVWPWRHPDRNVDALQEAVMRVVADRRGAPRTELFDAISATAHEFAAARGVPRSPALGRRSGSSVPPHMTEAWYCCAEPGPDLDYM
jgi:radical SAM superfamily enzyme YgiQ (UPF0313 family)